MSHAIATASQVQLVEYLLALVLGALNIASSCWINKLRRHKLTHKLCCAYEGCQHGVYDCILVCNDSTAWDLPYRP